MIRTPEDLERQMKLEIAVLRECLGVALHALRFDRAPLTVQAVRRIDERMRETGTAMPRIE